MLACSQDTRPASAYLLLHRSKKLGGAAHVCAHVCVCVCKRPLTPYWEWGTLCPQLLVKLVISPSRRLRREARLWPALPLHCFQILRGICNKRILPSFTYWLDPEPLKAWGRLNMMVLVTVAQVPGRFQLPEWDPAYVLCYASCKCALARSLCRMGHRGIE